MRYLKRRKLDTVITNRSPWAMRVALVLVPVLVGCTSNWAVTVSQPGSPSVVVDSSYLQELRDFVEPLDGNQGVPLERVLNTLGHQAIDRIAVGDGDAGLWEFEWRAVADDAWWLSDGSLLIGGHRLQVTSLETEAPSLLHQVEASITDVGPTAAAALGLPRPALATGRALEVPSASHVVLILLDGFGYVRYTEALADELIPNISALGEPLVALTTYPPTTPVSTASLLTGAPPEMHGVDRRGVRKTSIESLFDVAVTAGLQPVAIEGESLSFQLRNAELQLSGDLDGSGSTDDNVLANTLGVLQNATPDLLFVHFHGIDDAGHTHGPGAPEECAVITEEDAAVGRIMRLLPSDTLVVIFADHGMHAVEEEGRLGNHGHLLESDMFIPIFIAAK